MFYRMLAAVRVDDFFPKWYRLLFLVERVVLRSVSCGVSRVPYSLAVCLSDPSEVRQNDAQMLRFPPAWSRVSELAWVCQR